MRFKTILLAAFGAALLATMLPSIASAQDETEKVMKAEKHEGHEQMKAEKKMEKTTGQATFGNLIAALNNINVEIDEFETLDELTVTDVRVVNVQDVLEGNNIEELNNALNHNETEIDALQAFLNGVTVEVLDANNEVLTFDNVLNHNDVVVNDVIAIDVASGELVLFVQETEAEATGTETGTETTGTETGTETTGTETETETTGTTATEGI